MLIRPDGYVAWTGEATPAGLTDALTTWFGQPRQPTRYDHVMATKPVPLLEGILTSCQADGDAPVQTYIAAMPGWKRDLGRRLDALIVRTVPRVRKAVKCELAVLRIGARLVPQLSLLYEVRQSDVLPRQIAATCPPGGSKHNDAAISISAKPDTRRSSVRGWVTQATKLPGWDASSSNSDPTAM